MKLFKLLMVSLGLLISFTTRAGEADVITAEAICDHKQINRCNFQVTVRHADAGWDHYADKWDIMTPDGKVIATRVLYHPHENEQPFTRSLGNVIIDEDIREVVIRAHDSVHGYGGETFTLAIPGR